jgi:hypothetical protein
LIFADGARLFLRKKEAISSLFHEGRSFLFFNGATTIRLGMTFLRNYHLSLRWAEVPERKQMNKPIIVVDDI